MKIIPTYEGLRLKVQKVWRIGLANYRRKILKNTGHILLIGHQEEAHIIIPIVQVHTVLTEVLQAVAALHIQSQRKLQQLIHLETEH